MKAYVFPGQGAQFSGMGKELFETETIVKDLFEKADSILGFKITEIMFEGSAEDLKRTDVTQPAIFLHSVALALTLGIKPDMVAGHSLGEFSALVAADALGFEDGLRLVVARAGAMQKACEKIPGTMAAVLKMDDNTVERICRETEGIVVPANYNSPGQIVISGEAQAVESACEKLKELGARAMILPVGGAFHSPLMEPAREELARAIQKTEIRRPICPIYQNCDALPHTDPSEIKSNLLIQLTSPVRWTQSVLNMSHNGAKEFIELGPGKVLQGLITKILPEATVSGKQ